MELGPKGEKYKENYKKNDWKQRGNKKRELVAVSRLL